MKDFLLHLFPRFVFKDDLRITYTFCLGGLTFSAFLLLLLSGILLAFYYRPAPSEAYASILFLEESCFFGPFFKKSPSAFKQHLSCLTPPPYLEGCFYGSF